MAAVASPSELLIGRRSYYAPPISSDIRDPDFLPLLGGLDVKSNSPIVEKELSPFHLASFGPFKDTATTATTTGNTPSESSSPNPTSTSSLAPQNPLQELDAGPVSRQPSQLSEIVLSKAHAAAADSNTSPRSASSDSSHGNNVVSSASGTSDSRRASGGTSTAYAGSIVEEQFTATPSYLSAPNGKRFSTITRSSRSSVASSQHVTIATAPVSKYNRKPVPSSTTSRPTTITSRPPTPHGSPRLNPASSTTNAAVPVAQKPLPSQDIAVQSIPDPVKALLNPPLQRKTSTISERRLRALNSHPSNPSLRDHALAEPLSRDAEHFPIPPPTRVPRKSTDSRPTTPRKASVESKRASLRPTTSGFQIPAVPVRPSTAPGIVKAEQTSQESSTGPPLPSYQVSDHTEMASFMAKTHTVVFRRFDNVHIRLLLCLQDEIAQWERELIEVENVGSLTMDKIGQKAQIMKELRRVVAEYDHLYSNWSQMQANKADEQTMQNLRSWLKNPNSNMDAAAGAKVDLRWLEHTKDLSSVFLHAKGSPPQLHDQPLPLPKSKGYGGGKWYTSFFSSVKKQRQ